MVGSASYSFSFGAFNSDIFPHRCEPGASLPRSGDMSAVFLSAVFLGHGRDSRIRSDDQQNPGFLPSGPQKTFLSHTPASGPSAPRADHRRLPGERVVSPKFKWLGP